ncbi:MAG: M28 family peptidase [Alphaproteobacteria bacterium]|nr:M28 family peptidase [Alphaproteobacteria bacterium]MBL6939528.1 M28 family peptidase [Alphaproteobacteria bacterium]MBL7100098.1 M28 family peptidase [Alphaproteobacteria bacterium]
MHLRRLSALALLATAVPLAVWAAASQYPGHPHTVPEIVAADVMARDQALADDRFQGRGPGTVAGEAAAQWLADEMKRIGLKPGNHGSYFQNVPSVNIALDAAKSSLIFNTASGAVTPNFPEAAVYWTPQYATADVDVKKSPLVFVGYGVVAPEYHWNDYAGVDVKGKTVVILINDPGNEDANPDPAFFKGKAMTYYGRWTYKYEEAARQGAAAAIIVHETKPTAYGWQVVRNSNSGNKLWLQTGDKNLSMVPIQGWITLDTARDLFKRANLDYDQLKAAANKPGFKAVAMTGETLDVHAHSAFETLNTRNVIGIVPGTKHPDEVFLYTGHWDHLGVKPDVPGPDKIYNGAIDNGMGSASVLEIGEKFAAHPAERTIAIINWTLEEQGLLGSQYFAEHPVWPLNKIVGGVNLDGGLPHGHGKDLVLIGSGASELEDMLADILKTQNRVISPDPEPEKGGFYRSDHISLSRVGVPMLDPAGSSDLVIGGKEAATRIRDDYRTNHYHQPSDEFDPNWDISGVIDDLQALYALGDKLANSDRWPNWYKDNEFRAIRDKSMAGGK